MSYAPITLTNISMSVPGKILITNFSTTIPYGSKIGIIGRNGSGKSTLLTLIEGQLQPDAGSIIIPADAQICTVPQIITDHETLSGGQRFNARLSQALASGPTVLVLDEPTNHLDRHNRRSLMRMLQSFEGTLIIVSHDVELLRLCVNKLWHLEDGIVHVSAQSYNEYIADAQRKKEQLLSTIAKLNKQKRETHVTLMKEQERGKKHKAYGEKKYADGPSIVRKHQKKSSEVTSGNKRRTINEEKQATLEQLSKLRTPEIIVPTFTLQPAYHAATMLVTITDGSIGYGEKTVLNSLSLTIASNERVALLGNNGSGKSTLIKGILQSPEVIRTGYWYLPPPAQIGYLDQHYSTLKGELSILEVIQEIMPPLTPHAVIRTHLNRFLFRTNEEVQALVSTLSGGEKARLSLALIGACTPKLLILDEVTNNLDLETRQHVIEVLKEYPGALLVVSHDDDFLAAIGVATRYEIIEMKIKSI